MAEGNLPSNNDGRDFFNSFFSSALNVANLDDPSLRQAVGTQPSPKQNHTPVPLECGTDPGPSVEEMQSYVQQSRQQPSVVPRHIHDPNALINPLSKRLHLEDSPSVTDDSKANFEAAIERRLALTKSSQMYTMLSDEEEQDPLTDEALDDEKELHSRLRLASRSSSTATGTQQRSMSRIGSTGASTGTRTPVTDKDGLGFPAKGSLHRLHSTPMETANTTAKLSAAVKTILECLGEDPEREGLKRTPERYAKALLWMTRGYEERLNGAEDD